MLLHNTVLIPYSTYVKHAGIAMCRNAGNHMLNNGVNWKYYIQNGNLIWTYGEECVIIITPNSMIFFEESDSRFKRWR